MRPDFSPHIPMKAVYLQPLNVCKPPRDGKMGGLSQKTLVTGSRAKLFHLTHA